MTYQMTADWSALPDTCGLGHTMVYSAVHCQDSVAMSIIAVTLIFAFVVAHKTT
jgi:hypothetical protein